MPNVRLKDNQPLTSPMDADLIFTANSASSDTESKTTFAQAKAYFISGSSGVASIAGTANQITASAATGAVTLSIPSVFIAPGSIKATNATFTNTTNQIVLGTTNTLTISATAPVSSQTYTIPDAGASANFIMSSILNGGIGANQTISSGGLIVSTAYITAGSNGHAAGLTSYPSASSSGTLSLVAGSQSAGNNHSLNVTNTASIGQAVNYTLPDPGVTTAYFAVTPSLVNSAVFVTNSSGVGAYSSTMTSGQLIIGSTGGTPTAATLTAGAGVTITNGAGSITIAASGSAAVNLQTVYYSTKGRSGAAGTLSDPFATPNQALTYALTLTATVSNPVLIYGDPGTYHVTTAAMIYPNIYYGGTGVIWTQMGISTITFASSAAWSGSFANVLLKDIQLDSSLTLTLDSTGITSFNTTITLGDGFVTQNGPTFRLGNASHIYNLNIFDTVILDVQTTGVTFDGLNNIIAIGAHQISYVGTTFFNTTHASLNFYSIGNAGIGNATLTTTGSFAINFSAFAGNAVGINSSAAGVNSVSIFRDATTWAPISTYSGAQASTTEDVNITAQSNGSPLSLPFSSTINWDCRAAFAAAIEMTGNATLENPTGDTQGQIYALYVSQDITGGHTLTFSTNYIFPMGTPNLNTAGSQTSILQFFSVGNGQFVCFSPAGYKAPIMATTSLPSTLVANTTYYLDSASVVTKTLPASPNLGDIVKVRCNNSSAVLTVDLNTGQSMIFGSVSPTTSVTSTAQGDSMTFEASTGGSTAIWIAIAEVGNWSWT